jgi:hypothetical protein
MNARMLGGRPTGIRSSLLGAKVMVVPADFHDTEVVNAVLRWRFIRVHRIVILHSSSLEGPGWLVIYFEVNLHVDYNMLRYASTLAVGGPVS